MIAIALIGSPVIDALKEGEIPDSSDEIVYEYPPYIDQEEGKNAYIESLEGRIADMIIELEEKEEEIDRLNKEIDKMKNVSRETKASSDNKPSGQSTTFEATYYGMDCNGCSGTTASGLNIGSGTTYKGMKVIAVDRNVIPLHSIVEITHNGTTYKAVAKDTGGAIKGNRIDILVGSEAESSNYGRHNVEIRIIERGNNKYIRE